jgi:hypothetical protein
MPTHHVPKSGERPDVEVLGGERVVPGRTAHVDPGRRRRVVRAGAVPATGRPLTGDWSVPGRGCPRGLHRPLTRAALNGPRASWWPARSGSTFGAARPGATGVGSRYGALGQAVTMAWGPCHGLTAAWAAIKLADPGIARPGPCHGCMRQIPHATRGRVPVSVRTPSNVSTLPIRLLGSTRSSGRAFPFPRERARSLGPFRRSYATSDVTKTLDGRTPTQSVNFKVARLRPPGESADGSITTGQVAQHPGEAPRPDLLSVRLTRTTHQPEARIGLDTETPSAKNV